MKYLITLLLSISTFSLAHAEDYSWLQLNSDGKLELRYIPERNNTCPKIKLNNQLIEMNKRSAADKVIAKVTCYSVIPDGPYEIKINDTIYKSPKEETNKIVIVGDTGCAENLHDQTCKDSKNWPFGKIAKTIHKQEKFDYLLHLGDFHYHPKDFSFKDWKYEFFAPVRPILSDAPWINIRGNHEDCKRAHAGWFKFLDPFPYQDTCVKTSSLYSFNIGKYTFIIMDNSPAYDMYENAPTPYEEAEMIKHFSEKFQQVGEIAAKAKSNGLTSILVMHKPNMSIEHFTKDFIVNITMISAAKKENVKDLAMIISGHVHAQEALSMADDSLPPQIVSGNGGNSLVMNRNKNISNINEIYKETGVALDEFYGNIKFGYSVLSLDDDKLVVDFKDVHGKIDKTCIVKDRKLSCK